jgi:cell division protein FtsB
MSLLFSTWSFLLGAFHLANLLLSTNQLNKTEAELKKAKADAEAYTKETKAATMKKIDEFDKKVETEASKAKSGISSWFGGK